MKLNLGAGGRNIPTFCNVDISPDTKPFPPDVVDDITKLTTFKDHIGKIDLIRASHCLEHVKWKEITNVLSLWRHLLKPDGELYISVPDFEQVCRRYISGELLSNLRGFLNGGQRNEYDIHYDVFDEKRLTAALSLVGFKNIERYRWEHTEWSYIDSYEQAYLPHMNKGVGGQLMSLNIRCQK